MKLVKAEQAKKENDDGESGQKNEQDGRRSQVYTTALSHSRQG